MGRTRALIRLRNHDAGYGAVTKMLHWGTVLLLAAQFTVGYLLAGEDGSGHGRGHGRGEGGGHGRGGGGELDDGLLATHVVLGSTILLLAVLRLLWRRMTPLPPWAPGLSARERRLAGRTEQVLYLLLVLIPVSGLLLLLGSGEDLPGTDLESPVDLDDDLLLGVHVTTHVALFVTLAVHVGLVLKHQLVDRDGLLRRML